MLSHNTGKGTACPLSYMAELSPDPMIPSPEPSLYESMSLATHQASDPRLAEAKKPQGLLGVGGSSEPLWHLP